MRLKPRQRPHKPPTLDRKSNPDILWVFSYSGGIESHTFRYNLANIHKKRHLRVTSNLWVSVVEVEHSNVIGKGIIGAVVCGELLKQLSISHFTRIGASLVGWPIQVLRIGLSILRQHPWQPPMEFVGILLRREFAERSKIQIPRITLSKVCSSVGQRIGHLLTVWETVNAAFV